MSPELPSKPTITGSSVASGTIQPRPVLNVSVRTVAILEGTRDQDTSVWINGVQRIPAGSGPWSVPIDLAPGNNTLEIYCADAAENLSESEWVDIQLSASGAVVYKYDGSGRVKEIIPMQ